MPLHVKICGVTNVEDALLAVRLGADSVGINLVSGSKRLVSRDVARDIVSAVAGKAVSVAVVANLDARSLRDLAAELSVDRLQLHGDEPEAVVRAVPAAYKAVRIGGEADVLSGGDFPGDPLLVDANVKGELGGTGVAFDWALVVTLAKRRDILLAGGLTPENVARAVQVVRPWGVDVSSGVEALGDPRRKDPERVRAFIDNARAAAAP